MEEALSARIGWELRRAIESMAADGRGRSSGVARFVRTDRDGTPWVRLPGADADTPVNGAMLADAEPGQVVAYDLRDGRLSVSGNASSPAVGVERVRAEVAPAIERADAAGADAMRARAAADAAEADAMEAHESARGAASSARDALVQLATVEDVVGTVTWLAEHADFEPTADTEVDPLKVYYMREGDHFVRVAVPVASELHNYYELVVDEAMSEYVATHLALTDEGLWVLSDDDGYRLLAASDGVSVVDPDGHVVTRMGESIDFDSSRAQHIGSDDAYVMFTPASGATPASVTIGGNVFMGGVGRMGDLLDAVTYDHSFTVEGGTYTFTASVRRGGIDITDEVPPESLGWWLRTEDGDSWLGSGVTMSVSSEVAGYRASVIGGLIESEEVLVATSGGDMIVTSGGDRVSAQA